MFSHAVNVLVMGNGEFTYFTCKKCIQTELNLLNAQLQHCSRSILMPNPDIGL